MAQPRRISQNEDFKLVAAEILSNIELHKVDSEQKAHDSIVKQLENIEIREAKLAKYRAESALVDKDINQSEERGYNLGHGRSTGD